MNHVDELLTGVYSQTVTRVLVLVREVQVRIGVLTTPVAVRIYHDAKSADPFRFELSHRMKAPGLQTREAQQCGPTENETLRRALRMLTEDYEEAVRNGQLPDDAWLVKDGAR